MNLPASRYTTICYLLSDYTLYTIHYTLYTIHYTLYCILYTIYDSRLYTIRLSDADQEGIPAPINKVIVECNVHIPLSDCTSFFHEAFRRDMGTHLNSRNLESRNSCRAQINPFPVLVASDATKIARRARDLPSLRRPGSFGPQKLRRLP